MEEQVRSLIQAIHDRPGRIMFVAAGSGTQALAWLLGVAGASRTLLEALIPYDESSFDEFLGLKPEQYVAEPTARLLAGRAVTRARQLYRGAEPVIGLACTATIVTDRPKKGPHRAHIATWSAGRITHHTLALKKGLRDRNGEEKLVSMVLLKALAKCYQLENKLTLPLTDGDDYTWQDCDLDNVATELVTNRRHWFGVTMDGRLLPEDYRPRALLSGAFNPLHQGHLQLASVAEQLLGRQVTFEVAARNADKSRLSTYEVLRRVLQFAGRYEVMSSNAPTFVEKARLFRGTTFVAGYDTAERVIQPRFYGGSEENMLSALRQIRDLGSSFLVAGRSSDGEPFRHAENLAVPESFRDLFVPVPSELFRYDLSSTELREQGKPGSR